MSIMNHIGRCKPLLPKAALLIGSFALAASTAAAADETTQTAAGIKALLKSISPSGIAGAFFAALIVVIVIGAIFMFAGRRRHAHGHGEELYAEPTTIESSKFEQLLAETQGLCLRIQGGESKGYYRKIERLARIFMERIGVSGARQMSFEEIVTVLNGGTLPQKQSTALLSIFERCRQGAEHEGEKIEFTTAELIRDMRSLVKQAAEETSSKAQY